MEMNIVLVGVGGQGTLLASRVLGKFAIELGADVKVSEVHGMAQRGGSVFTFVRMGEEVRSPLVEHGRADYILAFEQMEAIRALPYLKEGGTLIMNTQTITPMPVITGKAVYPSDLVQKAESRARVIAMDAHGMAVQSGAGRAVNMVMLGSLCALSGGERPLYRLAIEACVPGRFLEANLNAFEAGYQETLMKSR